jgi:hypothetical protein
MNDFNTELEKIKVAYSNDDVKGKPIYQNISGSEWVAKLRNCLEGDKKGSHWLRTSVIVDDAGECIGRSNQKTESLARVLIIDADKHINSNGEEIEGAPDPMQVSHILKNLNLTHILHGSHSYYTGEKNYRYRILLITARQYKKEQLAPTIESILSQINIALVASGSNLLANAVENSTWSQSWYCPRKPRGNTIETLYLEYTKGQLVDVIEPLALPPINHTPPQKNSPNKVAGEISVIKAFNEQKSLIDALTYYGYKRILPNKWISPNSSSGVPGITVKDNKFFSHHADVFNDGYWHDCFDLYRVMENLKLKDAIITAAQNTYAPDGKTVDEYNKKLASKKKPPLVLPNPRPEVMKLHPNMLPEAMREFILDVADRQQSQPDFIAVAALVGLSCLLGRKVLIRPKQHDDWEVTPNQWGVIIGRPSAMKSPSMKAALKPLRKIEAIAAEQHAEDKQNYEEESQLHDLEQDMAKHKAKQALKVDDREQAREALKILDAPQVPTRSRLIVNDATVEKLGELLNENPNGLILVRDELSGWLSKLTKEEHQADRAFYLECFDGNGYFTYDRIGRGTIEIKYCTLSVIGGIQPTKIAKLVCDAMHGIADDGLIQRFQLAIWPDDIGSWVWLDRAPNEPAQEAYYGIFDAIDKLQIGNRPYLRFTPEAQLLFIQWMEEIQEKARVKDIHPAIESHMLKMPQTIAGLALLFEIIDGGREAVDTEATARALDWADYLLSHANRLYSVATNQSIDNARLILERKNKLPNPFSARDIHRKNWAGLDKIETINEALECLEDYHHLLSKDLPSTKVGGRPTISYQWNMIAE